MTILRFAVVGMVVVVGASGCAPDPQPQVLCPATASCSYDDLDTAAADALVGRVLADREYWRERAVLIDQVRRAGGQVEVGAWPATPQTAELLHARYRAGVRVVIARTHPAVAPAP